jgi:hypothetical protein
MDWEAVPCGELTQLVAYGSAQVYLVAADETGARLTRWRRRSPSFTEAQAARNVIVFPLGRGPGRPGGEPELAALAAMARDYAERFEAGEDLPGYPAWRHAAASAG